MKNRLLWTAWGLALALLAVLLVTRLTRSPDAPDPAAAVATTSGAATPSPRWRDFAVADEEPVERETAELDLRSARAFERGRQQLGRGRGDALRLQAVVFGERSMAIISGHILRPGDSIGDYRLTRIERSAVVLDGPSPRRLELSPPGAGSSPEEPSRPAEHGP